MEPEPARTLVIMLLPAILIGTLCAALVVRFLGSAIYLFCEDLLDRRKPAPCTLVPAERLLTDLRRLRQQLEARENRPGLTGKGLRMGAVRVAYVEVLHIACRQFEVRPPQDFGRPFAPLSEIYRAEAELRERGLDVRPPDWGQRAA